MEHAKAISKNVHNQQTASFFGGEKRHSFFGENNFFSPAVKPKLAVSNPGDPQEKEADMVADKVMRGPGKPAR